ncbi:MAG: NAD-dependent epimerase/dehydratase family protein, partial [Solirubrobacteraceae bacterium]
RAGPSPERDACRMRALVTGAAGFIGAHVVAALANGGADVRAFDRRAIAGATPGVEPIVGDILDPDALRRALQGCDAVFHLAALYSFHRADRARMREVNVNGTRAVLDAALRGPRRRIVHTSSCATCGPVPDRRATEHDLPRGDQLRIPYRATKLAGEQLALRAARAGADVVVVNPTVPVGAGDLRPTPTGKMIADVAHGRARAYLARSALNVAAVGDVAQGHLLAHEHGLPGNRYLLGGEDLSIRELFALVAQTAGLPSPRIAVPWTVARASATVAHAATAPFGHEPRLLLLDEVLAGRLPHRFDDAKARAQLGYSPGAAADALADAARAALAN